MLKEIEKLAYEYSKVEEGSLWRNEPKQLIRQAAFEAGFRKAKEMAAKEAKMISDFLDKIKYELYASVYTVEEDEFDRVFAVRDRLYMDFDKLGEKEV